MTKFIDGSKRNELKKEKRKTIFTRFVTSGLCVNKTIMKPSDYNNVEFLFNDKVYGDVFKAWNNINSDNVTLFFGNKGDEDYE